MNRLELIDFIKTQRSFLCVGLDTDIEKLPVGFPKTAEGMMRFNALIIDATMDFCVAYKINTAFYESLGAEGWDLIETTLGFIPDSHLKIADAKRADIGNTADHYAKTFFDHYQFHALTVAPYMGEDSVEPFLKYKDKWVALLALTSNTGSQDFQYITENGQPLYEQVMRKAMTWGDPDQLMFVCGATHADEFAKLRAIAPDNFFLVPGVGAQGGDLNAICRVGMNADCGLLVSASRSILYASSGEKFNYAASDEAERMQKAMALLLEEHGL
jgi:orotidine-5'-phosphate decarboxylase